MPTISADSLHRTAKYFMDSGKASSHAEAMEILESFGLSILVAPSIGASALEQTALLTLVNVAARTFLGGVEVVGLPECLTSTPLYVGRDIRDVVVELGGKLAVSGVSRPAWPVAVIGDVAPVSSDAPQWRLTWSGWRGGVTPAKSGRRLDEAHAIGMAPVLAATACAAEAFAYLSKTHPLAGRRAFGISLWKPTDDWLGNFDEPELSYLPSSLWLIGLGNLGQAFVWALASLDFGSSEKTALLLQDVDRIAISNHSTSVLSFSQDVGTKKTRVVARWLEQRGFETDIEERLFGEHSRRVSSEPRVALCGVDNPEARVALDNAGFGLVVEAGLGAGLDSFRSIGLHTFPASRSARNIWGKQIGQGKESSRSARAYTSLAEEGMDECGLVRLASRTIAVPFVGLIAGCLAISEVLRRLHGGLGAEVMSVSVLSLCDAELVPCTNSIPYAFGFIETRST